MRTKGDILAVFAGALLAILASCAGDEAYFRFRHVAGGKWHRDSVLVFTVDSLLTRPGMEYGVTVELTTNRGYPYRDLWLLIDQNLAGSLVRTDTLHCLLADEHGKWLGKGAGGLNQLSLPYHTFTAGDSVCNYRLAIRQGMDDALLHGIEKVGVKIAAKDGESW